MMTEDELRAHRRQQDVERKAEEEAALDQLAASLSETDAIAVVSRRTAADGGDRAVHRHQLRLACALRMMGSTHKEIAAEMGISTSQVGRLLREGQQLTQRHTLELLETTAIPLAMDNLIDGLRNGNERYTLEALKGGGILKAHSKHDGTLTGPPMAMQIVFSPPPNQAPLQAAPAHGQPLTLDVEATPED